MFPAFVQVNPEPEPSKTMVSSVARTPVGRLMVTSAVVPGKWVRVPEPQAVGVTVAPVSGAGIAGVMGGAMAGAAYLPLEKALERMDSTGPLAPCETALEPPQDRCTLTRVPVMPVTNINSCSTKSRENGPTGNEGAEIPVAEASPKEVSVAPIAPERVVAFKAM